MRRIAGQRQPRIDIAVRDHRRQRIAPSPADRADRAQMRTQPPADLPSEPLVVQCHERRRILGALGPDNRRDIRRTARFRIGARSHRQRGERAGRQEMLQRQVVMRPLMRDGADDRGLMIRNAGDRNARLLPQRRIAALGGDDQPAAGSPAQLASRTTAPSSDRSTAALAGANRCRSGCAGNRAFSALRSDRASTIQPNGRGVVAGFPMVEMQVQPGRRAADAPVTDADVADRVGRHVQDVPKPGILQQRRAIPPRSHRLGRRTPGSPSAAARPGRSARH